jgi:DNA-binding GntR family transcriptional regulator
MLPIEIQRRPLMSKEVLHRDEAYNRLLEMILAGTFRHDDSLSERSLATTLGLGRTPTREALHRLSREGMLEVIPAKGTFVKRPSIDELRELYEVRFALEGMAAYLAAKNNGSPALKESRVSLEKFRAKGDEADLTEIRDVGWQMHLEIFKAAQNETLSTFYRTLISRITLVMNMILEHDHDRVRITISEHLDILDAIDAGDPIAARDRILKHLEHAFDARLRIYQRVRGYGSGAFAESQ